MVTPDGTKPLAASRDILYDNGPLVNLPGGGFGGADASVLETALGLSSYGFGNQTSAGYWIADDFVVNPGEIWNITQFTFYAYQTGSTTTSTITGGYVRIYSGDPYSGGTVIWGDETTNRLLSSDFTGIYRSIDTDPLASNRPIMDVVCETPGLQLSEGTYWVAWQVDGSLASGPWAPPISIAGVATTGNAQQYTTAWGGAYSGTIYQQGFPFLVDGTIQPPSVAGYVLNGGGQTIAGVTIEILENGRTATTGPTGYYDFYNLPDATYTLEATKDGYNPATASVTTVDGTTVTQNFTLTAPNITVAR